VSLNKSLNFRNLRKVILFGNVFAMLCCAVLGFGGVYYTEDFRVLGMLTMFQEYVNAPCFKVLQHALRIVNSRGKL